MIVHVLKIMLYTMLLAVVKSDAVVSPVMLSEFCMACSRTHCIAFVYLFFIKFFQLLNVLWRKVR